MDKASLADCPVEILSAICAAVFTAGLPAPVSSLDPLVLHVESPPPTALPSSLPSGNWSEPVARKTLASLCLVNKALYEAAKPWLWRKVEVRLPRSWISLLEEVCGEDPESSTSGETTGFASLMALSASASTSRECSESSCDSPQFPDMTIPPELLSPPASRDPSPARLRAKSPERWRFLEAVNNAVHNSEPGLYGTRFANTVALNAR